MYQRGEKARLNGRTVEIIQADPAGIRYVVRVLDSGAALPVSGHQLSPYTPEAVPSDLDGPIKPAAPVLTVVPSGPHGPPAQTVYGKIASQIHAWKPMDGFEFHRILREADEAKLINHNELAKENSVSVSSVRNWISGSLRPPPNIQRAALNHVMSNIGSADIRRELERHQAEEDAFLEGDLQPESRLPPPEEAPMAGRGLDALKEAALRQEQQFIEVRGRSLTVNYTVLESGKWKAEITELPGLVALGESKMDALFDVKALAIDKIEKSIPRKS